VLNSDSSSNASSLPRTRVVLIAANAAPALPALILKRNTWGVA